MAVGRLFGQLVDEVVLDLDQGLGRDAATAGQVGIGLFPVGDLVLPLLVAQADAVGDFLQQLDLLLLPIDELLEQADDQLVGIDLVADGGASWVGRQTSMLNMGENRRGSWDIGEGSLRIPSIYTRAGAVSSIWQSCAGCDGCAGVLAGSAATAAKAAQRRSDSQRPSPPSTSATPPSTLPPHECRTREAACRALGFLTVVENAELGLLGGYLLLNAAGRPLEFHCTAPVKPSRTQEILYGPTLQPFRTASRLGKLC